MTANIAFPRQNGTRSRRAPGSKLVVFCNCRLRLAGGKLFVKWGDRVQPVFTVLCNTNLRYNTVGFRLTIDFRLILCYTNDTIPTKTYYKKRVIMKWMKKGICVVLSLAILGSSAGCSQPLKDQRIIFDEYIDSLPTKMISSDSMDLNFLFDDPSAFGFEEELMELPYTSREEYEQNTQEVNGILEELMRFERESLREDQKETYDILVDYLERYLAVAPYYYLDNNYLGSYIGFQAQLPLLLSEFSFNRRNDLDSYFHILETAEETFLNYAQLEKERQKQGVGMSQTILDKVIEQCDNFTKEEDIFLIEAVNEKIDAVPFLTEEEKKEAKQKNERLLKNDFLNAYKSLRQELSTIQASGEDLGLAHQPDGKAYYEALLKRTTGLDLTPEEVKTYLQQHLQAAIEKVAEDQRKAPEAYQRYINGEAPVYSDFTTVEETLDYLAQRINEDYPPISNLNYTVYMVPEEMADNFSPAAYMSNHVDAPMDENESMFINGEYQPSLFPTLAHEGYPGHMYQNVYLKAQQKPAVQYLVNYSGYTEGWATYVELNSYQYGQGDPDILQIERDMQVVTNYVIALMDIGVHYEGWDRETFTEYMRQWFGDGVSQEMCDGQFDLVLESPTNYLKYYLSGAKFQDLYDKAQEALGDRFDSVKYHEALLSCGPAPFDLLEERVDEYIHSTQEGRVPSYEASSAQESADAAA